MASDTNGSVDLSIAAYSDPDAAHDDWDAIRQLVGDDVLTVDHEAVIDVGGLASFDK